jgi:hypothetical protein
MIRYYVPTVQALRRTARRGSQSLVRYRTGRVVPGCISQCLTSRTRFLYYGKRQILSVGNLEASPNGSLAGGGGGPETAYPPYSACADCSTRHLTTLYGEAPYHAVAHGSLSLQ